MSGPARVVTFALALLAVFAGAAAVGYAVGPLDRGQTTVEESHGGEAEAMAEPGPPAATGLRAEITSTAPIAFRIATPTGTPVRSYDVQHERPMHLIAVRNDLATFSHVHPTRRGDRWLSRLRLPPGAYTAYADFSPEGRRAVLSEPLVIPGAWRARPLPAPAATAKTGPYVVELDTADITAEQPAMLSFRVLRDGEDVEVDPYLGARGHLVVLRAGDLAYLHTHADEDALDFETTFPSPGRYRAFLQFSVGGEVQTAGFTVEVPE